jgi:hypothetical protein
MTQLAQPVMAICMLLTTAEVDKGKHMTVLYQELGPCVIDNGHVRPRPVSLANIFTEIARAREAGRRPFRFPAAEAGCGKTSRKKKKPQ